MAHEHSGLIDHRAAETRTWMFDLDGMILAGMITAIQDGREENEGCKDTIGHFFLSVSSVLLLSHSGPAKKYRAAGLFFAL
jgi:hypothetical protein